MEQKELIIRVLATMRTDLAAKKFSLDGLYETLDEDYDANSYQAGVYVEGAMSDINSAINNINATIQVLNS